MSGVLIPCASHCISTVKLSFRTFKQNDFESDVEKAFAVYIDRLRGNPSVDLNPIVCGAYLFFTGSLNFHLNSPQFQPLYLKIQNAAQWFWNFYMVEWIIGESAVKFMTIKMVKGTDFLNFVFLRKFKISREKLRNTEKNQNNLRKFKKMKFLEKTAKLRSEIRVTAVRYMPTWSRIIPRREQCNMSFRRSVALFIIVSAMATTL